MVWNIIIIQDFPNYNCSPNLWVPPCFQHLEKHILELLLSSCFTVVQARSPGRSPLHSSEKIKLRISASRSLWVSFKILLCPFKTTNLPFSISSWPEKCDGSRLGPSHRLFWHQYAPQGKLRPTSVSKSVLLKNPWLIRRSLQKPKLISLAFEINTRPAPILSTPCHPASESFPRFAQWKLLLQIHLTWWLHWGHGW